MHNNSLLKVILLCCLFGTKSDIWITALKINPRNAFVNKWYLSLHSTHWVRVTHICVSTLTIIGSDDGLSPSLYLIKCWNIVDYTLWNKLQWNLNRNLNISIQENAFENVVWKMAAILSRPQCVNFQCVLGWRVWEGGISCISALRFQVMHVRK